MPALRGSAAECVVDAKETDPRPDASVVIEVVAFSHGAFWYGLLGAVFTWARGDCLTMTVRAGGGQPMGGSLAWAPRRPLLLGAPRPWYIALCDELGLHYDS